MAPKGAAWEQAVEHWRTLKSDEGATYDIEVELNAANITPYVSWGTSPEMVGPIDGVVPNPSEIQDEAKRQTVEGALDYMDIQPGMKRRISTSIRCLSALVPIPGSKICAPRLQSQRVEKLLTGFTQWLCLVRG